MDTDILFWISGAIVGVAGLTLLVSALFADRSRGRRRCSKCWYDMSKTAGTRCPECGRLAKRERDLFRIRRKWRWAFASMIVILGAVVLAIQPRVQDDGWASVTPATILILALDMNDPQWALDGLHQRVSIDISQTGLPVTGFSVSNPNALYAWQWRMIATPCIRILDSSLSATTRTTALELLCRSEVFVTDEAASDAVQDTYWRHALDPDQHIHGVSVLTLSDDRDQQRGLAPCVSCLSMTIRGCVGWR